MTLEQVMAMEGAALNAPVAEHIGWVGEPWKYSPIDGMPFDRPFPPPVPEFHHNWGAAMLIREWARGLTRAQQRVFLTAVECCAEQRLGPFRKGWIVMDMETIDLARAALLVTI